MSNAGLIKHRFVCTGSREGGNSHFTRSSTQDWDGGASNRRGVCLDEDPASWRARTDAGRMRTRIRVRTRIRIRIRIQSVVSRDN